MVKTFWRYVYSLRQTRTWQTDTDRQTDGETDGRTLHDGISRADAQTHAEKWHLNDGNGIGMVYMSLTFHSTHYIGQTPVIGSRSRARHTSPLPLLQTTSDAPVNDTTAYWYRYERRNSNEDMVYQFHGSLFCHRVDQFYMQIRFCSLAYPG